MEWLMPLLQEVVAPCLFFTMLTWENYHVASPLFCLVCPEDLRKNILFECQEVVEEVLKFIQEFRACLTHDFKYTWNFVYKFKSWLFKPFWLNQTYTKFKAPFLHLKEIERCYWDLFFSKFFLKKFLIWILLLFPTLIVPWCLSLFYRWLFYPVNWDFAYIIY